MNEIQLTFYELFYGSGAWLGILLLLSIIIALSAKVKYGGLLCFPIAVIMGIDYLTNDLIWHGLIMFIASIFIVFQIFKTRD